MQRILCGLLCSLLIGCATKPPEATEQEKQDANLAFLACLHAAVPALDDGVSDAGTVALALRPKCAAEFARASNAGASGGNPAAQAIFHRRYDDQLFMQTATMVVLDERKHRRGQ